MFYFKIRPTQLSSLGSYVGITDHLKFDPTPRKLLQPVNFEAKLPAHRAIIVKMVVVPCSSVFTSKDMTILLKIAAETANLTLGRSQVVSRRLVPSAKVSA